MEETKHILLFSLLEVQYLRHNLEKNVC